MQLIFDRFWTKKISILVVCTANVCRSPMGHAILREIIKYRGLKHKVRVDSAGTHVPINGRLPDKRSLKVLEEEGIDIKSLKTRQLKIKDIEKFDYIVVMDKENKAAIEKIIGKKSHKVRLLMEFSVNTNTRAGIEVPDPYYGHPSEFKSVFKLVEVGCSGLLKQVCEDHNLKGKV